MADRVIAQINHLQVLKTFNAFGPLIKAGITQLQVFKVGQPTDRQPHAQAIAGQIEGF